MGQATNFILVNTLIAFHISLLKRSKAEYFQYNSAKLIKKIIRVFLNSPERVKCESQMLTRAERDTHFDRAAVRALMFFISPSLKYTKHTSKYIYMALTNNMVHSGHDTAHSCFYIKK